MRDKKTKSDDFVISFQDIFAIFKKAKIKLLLGALGFCLFALYWTLSTSIEYQAEATFKDKNGSANRSISMFLSLGSVGVDSEAMTYMKSRKVMLDLVAQMGLQAEINPQGYSKGIFQTMWESLLAEYEIYNHHWNPLLKDPIVSLQALNIDYKEELPTGFSVKFISEDAYEVHGLTEKPFTALLDQVWTTDRVSLSLHRKKDIPLKDQFYSITLFPETHVADTLAKLIKIEPDRNDKNLISIKYSNRDRCLACEVVNNLMEAYKRYLKVEQDRLVNLQIAYLEHRQEEMGSTLHAMMENYAQNMSSDMSTTGFATSSMAMEYLTHALNQFKERLLQNDFEVKRLIKAQKEEAAYYEGNNIHTGYINQMLAEIRSLRQQRVSIELALRNSLPFNEAESKDNLSQQLEDLEEIRNSSQEVKRILAGLEKKELLEPSKALYKNSRYLVGSWYDKLKAAEGIEKIEWENNRGHFMAYLTNLLHLLHVHKKTIQERLAHQQTSPAEFQGIEIGTAKELYINYTKQVNEIEAQMLQNMFTIEQMKNANFELSSLTVVLQDPISSGMINKASSLALSLQDQKNRTQKEIDRIIEELDLQKRFLTIHLQHGIDILQLRKDLFKKKIYALQNVTLGLIHEQVSILEKHLADFIVSRLNDLKQEKSLIEQQKHDLRDQMVGLPGQWVAEKLIDQQMELNKRMMEEVTRLVESKNISNNLEIIQSSPIDKAIPPLHPKSPRLIFFAILGLFMGTFLTGTFVIVRSLLSGIVAGEENLKLSNQHVSGYLNKNLSEPVHDTDLATLRRLISLLEPLKKLPGNHNNSLLLVEGKGPDYSKILARLLFKKGLKILLVPLTFDKPTTSEELPGLLQYLEGGETPKIHHSKEFDFISAGGITRYGNELIGGKLFQDLFSKLQTQYDCVIASTQSNATNAEIETLLQLFSHVAISLHGEKLEDLKVCMNIAEDSTPKKTLSFLFY